MMGFDRIFLSGFFFSMSIVLFILFYYNSGKKNHLIYALNTLALSAINILALIYSDHFGVGFVSKDILYSLIHLLNFLIGIGFVYFIVYTVDYGFLFARIFLVCSVLICILFLYDPRQFYNWEITSMARLLLSATQYIGTIVLCVVAIRRRIPYFGLMLTAILFAVANETVVGNMNLFHLWDSWSTSRTVFWITGCSLSIAIGAAYFSKDLALVSKKLVEESTRLAQEKYESQQLKEIDSLKSRFFANISHEFRTPLTLILGPLEKRLSFAIDQTDRNELSVMHRNASRLLVLINQLLDFSRLEAGTLKLSCSYGKLQTAIQSVASQFSSMADSKKIHFDVLIKQNVFLFYDQDKLEKIMTNLLSNAFKFTPPGGSIILTIDQQLPTLTFKKGCAEIEITDTGMGIGSDHLSKIFDRFYQVDMSNTRSYEGSGIGLSLTKELVELHHGTIEVKSELSKGSIFKVCLPLGKDHLKPDEIIVTPEIDENRSEGVKHVNETDDIAALDNSDPTLTQESILIIEDNQDLRSYIRHELQQFYKIEEAADGEQGIAVAIQQIPTLIITDLMMPKKDGLNVCQELKTDERTSHIPIILLTAKADIESRLAGYKQGADDYISKPFNVLELRVRIENLIAIRKKLQTKFAQPITVLPSAITTDSADGRFLKRAVEIVEAHLADSKFGVEPLALEMNVSQTQLYRKLHAVTGSGPNEFIRHIRLHYAANLLRNQSGNVSEIAYLAGFNNLSYFSKVFKEKFGITPNEFLKNPPVSSN